MTIVCRSSSGMEKKRGDPETVDKKGREGALKMESGRLEGNGVGTVGRVVTFNTSGPRFY